MPELLNYGMIKLSEFLIVMPRNLVDLTGSVFGRLKVLGVGERDRHQRRRWICLCECGNETLVSTGGLRSGNTRSCGCLAIDLNKIRSATHGATRGGIETPTYRTWKSIIQRCENPSHKDWRLYGGKGIKMSPEWRQNYSQFLADMGEKPSSKHSIDRIDSNDDYKPSNCRWATFHEQSRNTSQNHWITYNGKTQCLVDWAKEVGLTRVQLSDRLNKLGWSVEKAFTTPIQAHCRGKKYG